MQFILDQQAATAAWQEGADRKLKGLQVLVQAGMKMIIKLHQQQRDLQERVASIDTRVDALIDAQSRTEAKLDRLIRDLGKRGGNGHGKEL